MWSSDKRYGGRAVLGSDKRYGGRAAWSLDASVVWYVS